MKITIYTITDCAFSKQEKDYLAAKGLTFEEKNLETTKEFLTEMLTLSNNFAGTPVTKIEKDDGQIMILKGFSQSEFDAALGFSSAAPAVVAEQPVATPTVEPVVTPAPIVETPTPVAQVNVNIAPPVEPTVAPTMDVTAPAVAPIEIPVAEPAPTAPTPSPAAPGIQTNTDLSASANPTIPTFDISIPPAAETPAAAPVVPSMEPAAPVITSAASDIIAPAASTSDVSSAADQFSAPLSPISTAPVAANPTDTGANGSASLDAILSDLQSKVDSSTPTAPTPPAAPTTPTTSTNA